MLSRRATSRNHLLAIGMAFLAIGHIPAKAHAAIPLIVDSVPDPQSAPALVQPDLDTWLDGLMPYALAKGDIAGAVVVVVKDGSTLTQRGYGYADFGARRPVDPDATLFRMGSVSKLVLWTAVMQLVEQGKLDLDTNIDTYLDFHVPGRNGKPITLRNIMTHTAGFEEVIRGVLSPNDNGPESIESFVKRWVPERIFAPGTTPAYSNYGAMLAGYIVERQSGMSFYDYVDRNVFSRIAMHHSTFRQPLPVDLKPMMSDGYALGSASPKPFELMNHSAAGGMTSSGADIAKFMIAQLSDGGALLTPETTKLMHATQLQSIPPLNGMALGFYEQNINGRRIIGHGGDTQWFHTYLWLLPSEHVGLFIALNSSGAGGASNEIRAELHDRFFDRYFPPQKTGHLDFRGKQVDAQLVAGTYVSSRRAESSFFKVMEIAGQLRILAGDNGDLVVPAIRTISGQTRTWKEIAPYVWQATDNQDRLAAKVVDGTVLQLSFDAISPFQVFEPAPWYSSSTWLKPALLAALALLFFTALSSPVRAIARYACRRRFSDTPFRLTSYHLVCVFAALTLIVLFGWAFTLKAMWSDFHLFNGKLDGLVKLLQLGGLVVFSGLVGTALFHTQRSWRSPVGWFPRFWIVLVVMASVVVWWVAINFHLLKFGVEY